jgi:hypothetical protein
VFVDDEHGTSRQAPSLHQHTVYLHSNRHSSGMSTAYAVGAAQDTPCAPPQTLVDDQPEHTTFLSKLLDEPWFILSISGMSLR